MERMDDFVSWESDFCEIDDVLDAAFFTFENSKKVDEDDDLQEGQMVNSNPILEL